MSNLERILLAEEGLPYDGNEEESNMFTVNTGTADDGTIKYLSMHFYTENNEAYDFVINEVLQLIDRGMALYDNTKVSE